MRIFTLIMIIVILLMISCDKHEFNNLIDPGVVFPAPTDLDINGTSITSCELSWNDNSTGEEGFKIDRKKDSENWVVPYQTLGENATSLTETGLNANSTYQYRVYGYSGENSSTSITGEINMTFPAPTDFNVEQSSLTSCSLTWSYNGFSDEEGFKLERRLAGGSWNEIAQLGINITSFEDTGLTEEETYEYMIYAYNAELPQGNTATQSITMQILCVDYDGNVYEVVQIGDQWWTTTNLKTTRYWNGDAIDHLTSDNDWTSTSSGAYCAYNNDEGNVDNYGYLYNWYAASDDRGFADGWHVPGDAEIMILEMELGMSETEANDTGYRGTNEGSKLAGRADLWSNGDLENDPQFGSSGFDFVPGGYR
ncbi:MAG: fibronectin type III domain-containing protein, partial [Candidatus Cloacimonetes bacterium]|nr:fibronectin type III domain-containing protein [Candidatus Cloacimonadota bacterium]